MGEMMMIHGYNFKLIYKNEPFNEIQKEHEWALFYNAI